MKIAILGATSQIAKDLIISFSKYTNHYCILFSRMPERVNDWLKLSDLKSTYASLNYTGFSTGDYDVIINFVGVGDPARAKAMGASIFEITHQYDQMALDYIQQKPSCKYIFLSSGAVYGDVFDQPVTKESGVKIPINDLKPSHWYGIAKLYAEARHRALSELSIVDVRVFNYFSHTQDIEARFFITDIVRAIRDHAVLKTSPENIVRDYLHPDDFFQLVECILHADAMNMAVDCYSKEPVGKMDLLSAMQENFGLSYAWVEPNVAINATGSKLYYYSQNKVVSAFGYNPKWSSLGAISRELGVVLK